MVPLRALSAPVPYRYCPILTTNFPSFFSSPSPRFFRTTIEHIDIPRRKDNNNQGRGGPTIAVGGRRRVRGQRGGWRGRCWGGTEAAHCEALDLKFSFVLVVGK